MGERPRSAGLQALAVRAANDVVEPTAAIAGPARRFRERHARPRGSRRGGLIVRALVIADVAGLSAAFVVAQLLAGRDSGAVDTRGEVILFVASLPGWIVVAKLLELYDRDEERTGYTTIDDLVGVFHLVTTGAWLFLLTTWVVPAARLDLAKLALFWSLAIACVTAGRGVARAICRRLPGYAQNTVIVGAGDVGQLVARKLRQHPEYGVELVGFVDAEPRTLRGDLVDVPVLGQPADLAELVTRWQVERVIVAFSQGSHDDELRMVRALKNKGIQIDIVPRLYETLGPNVSIHAVEGLALVGLPTAKPFPLSRALKRGLDIVVSGTLLVLAAPLLAYIAVRVKRDSPGPVFFRQARLGQHMNEFTMLKFRTMRVGTSTSAHREYVERMMDTNALPYSNGIFKQERADEVTPFGRVLRKTSLDELPNLINVLRGEMSLVGPRPCIQLETEYFQEHHFARFDVPAGITGLWQVTARAHSPFREALELDVAYAHNWSLGLDLWLLLKTPFTLIRPKVTA